MNKQLSWDVIQSNAVTFSKRHHADGDEKPDGQNFMRDFLAVFGISEAVGRFEERAMRESGRGYMDYLWPKMIAIEMKSKGKNLDEAYEQLKDYVFHLPPEKLPDLLMVSDFENIVLYRRTTNKKWQFKTKEFHQYVDHFHDIAGFERHYEIADQENVNVRAAHMMARLHDDLRDCGYRGHVLEVYLVRLLFCMFAEDTGIFPQDYFLSYVKNSKDLSGRLGKLFEVLNMPNRECADHTPLSTADFDAKLQQTLIQCCMFDWSKISPAIFGSMFQGIMDKDIRRELGVHYTDEDNILKVVNPLFMDALWAELERVKTNPRKLDEFHEKIAQLKFLDPACGCGNFLMIAYQELRKLEIEIARRKMKRAKGQKVFDISTLLKVNVEQFYGIEIEDFPCEVARVGMWLMDHLMNLQASTELGQYFERLPLTQGATIIHGNALRINWEDIVQKNELSYILGNPPYSGARTMTPVQKEDMHLSFGALKGVGNLDYVTAWYKKAADMMNGTEIRTAFVSTNSITQGEQVAILWKPLMERGMMINFAYRTFKWTNEAPGKAAVHCVVIGFSFINTAHKYIFDGKIKNYATKINPYLVDAPDIFIESRSQPLCDVPNMVFGSMPNDGGHLIIEANEYRAFLRSEPSAKKFIRRFVGAVESINNLPRYCLWLVDATQVELQSMPLVLQRIEQVRDIRSKSRAAGTRKKAKTSALFYQISQPKSKYILVPRVSSERRDYIPIGFMSPKIIASDATLTVSNATLYHFGILTSSVHMAWMRAVCGRLEMRYRYSKDIVYNNFPWPDVSDDQKTMIETLAKAVLDTRAKFPDSSLADLYDPLTMPKELLKAHQSLDRAVMKLYKFKNDSTESSIVAALMEMYQKLTVPPTLIPELQSQKSGKGCKKKE